MAVPHFAAAPRFAAPRMGGARFAPRFAAAPHFAAPRRAFAARPRMAHFAAPRRALAPRFAAAPHAVAHHVAARTVPHAVAHHAAARTAPHFHAATAQHISTSPKETAHAPSALAPHVGAETKQHTHAQVVPHAGPAHLLPGLAPLAPLVAPHHAQGPAGGEHAAGGRAAAERAANGQAGAERKSRVPGPPAGANPRRVGRVSAAVKPHVVAHRPEPLRWTSRAEVPRAGKAGKGRPGIMDPGGYIRTPKAGAPSISRGDFNRRLNAIANANTLRQRNNAFRNTQIGTWPGSWYPVPGWQTTGGWWNNSNLGYYNNYWWNGQSYPWDYYAMAGYLPTPYIFDVASGLFLDPSLGYFDALPNGYDQPITVAITEVVPEYDYWGNVIAYRSEVFYYNAIWDPAAQAYGYYDYRGQFHWTTFPWLHSWMGEYMP